jgi:hypothetical protein
MKVVWNHSDELVYGNLYINGMRVGWIQPYGDAVRAVIAPKLREAMDSPAVFIYRTQEEAKTELEGICTALLIGEQYGT